MFVHLEPLFHTVFNCFAMVDDLVEDVLKNTLFDCKYNAKIAPP